MTASATALALRAELRPLADDPHFDQLLDEIGTSSIVLLGESTHGTSEFYRLRTEITKRLVVERGFDAIAVECDWPDALRVSRYVQHSDGDIAADGALAGFQRFPQWMWRNTETVALVEWLRAHNAQAGDPARRVGFYGLDLYSLRKSMHAVIAYLEQEDPAAARRARERYACIDHMADYPQRYGYAATFGMTRRCEDELVGQLRELSLQAARHMARPGAAVPDQLFYAQQNARVARNAETYYRAMFQPGDAAWNVRDTHMADTLQALRQHLGARKGRGPARIVVWAHNSHIGDVRATEMGEGGQLNLGQLVRENHPPGESFLLGFTTHTGSVTAASDWDGPAERKAVQPSLPHSIERLLHASGAALGCNEFLLPLRGRDSVLAHLPEQLIERAIGVVYRPETERRSHYFRADPVRQFDALIHVDRSTAVQPLERSAAWVADEAPETYPSGL